MFEIIKNAFTALGEFITGLFSSFWSGVLTVVFLICFTGILITLIITYQNSKAVEHHIVDTDGEEVIIVKKQKEADEKV